MNKGFTRFLLEEIKKIDHIAIVYNVPFIREYSHLKNGLWIADEAYVEAETMEDILELPAGEAYVFDDDDVPEYSWEIYRGPWAEELEKDGEAVTVSLAPGEYLLMQDDSGEVSFTGYGRWSDLVDAIGKWI